MKGKVKTTRGNREHLSGRRFPGFACSSCDFARVKIKILKSLEAVA
jgi:hypothetical protein